VKVAITGKGGSGKTTMAGTLSRCLAARGHAVVAVDADPNPNLGTSLGLPADLVEGMEPILNALLGAGFTHHDPKPDPEDLLSRYGIATDEGVVLVATGRIERPIASCLCCGSHITTREFFGELSGQGRMVVADLEAGLNDLIWAGPGPDDVVVAVAEPSAKAVEIARRACRVAQEMGVTRLLGVANRCTDERDQVVLAEALGLDVLAVPEDPAVERADQLGIAPVDADPSSPAVLAVAQLADWFERA
jgi:CO dehydrogenase maturation factor